MVLSVPIFSTLRYFIYLQQDQLNHLQERLSQTEEDLKEHQTYPPVKGSKSSLIQHFLEKESYLEFEVGTLCIATGFA